MAGLHMSQKPLSLTEGPQVHCSHVGPSGGGKCTNVNYNDVYFDDQQLFGRPAGDIFMCPGIVR